MEQITVKQMKEELSKLDDDLVIMHRHGLRHISPVSKPEIVAVQPAKECNPTYYGEFEEISQSLVKESTMKAVKI